MSKLFDLVIELVARRNEQYETFGIHGGSHPNTPAVRAELTELLSEDCAATCELLSRDCEEPAIYWISEVFDNVSERLQSWEFIDCIEELQRKFPNVNMKVDIEYSIKAMKTKRN